MRLKPRSFFFFSPPFPFWMRVSQVYYLESKTIFFIFYFTLSLHSHTDLTLRDSFKAAEGWGRQGEFWVKLEDKLQLNLSKMRWSSLPLELLRKDRSVCVLCCFVYMCVEQGCRVSTVGGGGISLCFLLWDIINCSISSAQCNPVLFLLSLLQFLHIWPNCCLLDCLLFARFFFFFPQQPFCL